MVTVTASPGQIWWHKYKRYHVKVTVANDEAVYLSRVELEELAGRPMWVRTKRSLSRRVLLSTLVDRYRFAELEA